MISKIFGNGLIRKKIYIRQTMADTAEAQVTDQSNIAREIQSLNEEVSQWISTF